MNADAQVRKSAVSHLRVVEDAQARAITTARVALDALLEEQDEAQDAAALGYLAG